MAEEAPEEVVASPSGSGSNMGRLIAAAFMGIVILAECAVAYMFIPGADDMTAQATGMAKDELKKEAEATDDKKEKTEEVELGKFNIAWHIPAAEKTLRADFDLIGIVPTKRKSAFQAIYDNNQHRLRSLVIFEIRNSTAADLNDARLGLIKRRILEKSNALFGEPFLVDLAFSKYSFLPE